MLDFISNKSLALGFFFSVALSIYLIVELYRKHELEKTLCEFHPPNNPCKSMGDKERRAFLIVMTIMVIWTILFQILVGTRLMM